MQAVYQIIAAYFEDDCADERTNDPVMTAILEKDALASQPTLSRFWNRMDKDTLTRFDEMDRKMREIVYSVKPPEHILFDLDSALLNTYGHQEGEGFNYHYQAHGYHPLLCFDGLTGDLLKAELRDGTQYCSKDADRFLSPLMQEYRKKYPSLPIYLRGDSGFASPDLYEAGEANDCKYAIRLRVHALAYNLFNWFRRLALSATMRKQRPVNFDNPRSKPVDKPRGDLRPFIDNSFNYFLRCQDKNMLVQIFSGKLSL